MSGKEREALTFAANGLTFKEIADALCVTHSAIKKRIVPMYKRFDVKSLAHLVSFAHQNHLLDQ
jgi:DNA-binding NarL/FixJ family response regulator